MTVKGAEEVWDSCNLPSVFFLENGPFTDDVPVWQIDANGHFAPLFNNQRVKLMANVDDLSITSNYSRVVIFHSSVS